MVIINDLTEKKSIWQPQFLEEINQDICLDCDRFNEVGGGNALKLLSIKKDNLEQQIMTIANPKQCADCDVCTNRLFASIK